MNQQELSKSAKNWLKNQFTQHQNGIIVEQDCCESFGIVQNFITSVDSVFKTPVIYYEAFPQESAVQFVYTLREELVSKLGEHKVSSCQSITDIIKLSSLEMIIVNNSYLYSIDTLNSIIRLFANCNVCLILIGSYDKMVIAQIFDRPTVAQWERYSLCKAETN